MSPTGYQTGHDSHTRRRTLAWERIVWAGRPFVDWDTPLPMLHWLPVDPVLIRKHDVDGDGGAGVFGTLSR